MESTEIDKQLLINDVTSTVNDRTVFHSSGEDYTTNCIVEKESSPCIDDSELATDVCKQIPVDDMTFALGREHIKLILVDKDMSVCADEKKVDESLAPQLIIDNSEMENGDIVTAGGFSAEINKAVVVENAQETENEDCSHDEGVNAIPVGKEQQNTIYIWLRAIFRLMCCILNCLLVMPTYILWCYMLLPLRYVAPELFQSLEQIPFGWIEYFVGHWLWTAGYLIYESGDNVDDLLASRQCLVIANHQSTGDVPIFMAIMSDPKKHPVVHRLYWVMDYIFRFTPFGEISSFHGDFFIQQGKATRQSQLVELKHHLQKVYLTRDRTCLILFPEGGFLRKRRETSQAYGRKYGYPILQHVTLPRVGAMQTILNTLAPSSPEDGVVPLTKRLEWVIDVTVAYPDGGKPLDLFAIFFAHRPPCRTVIHYRRYRTDQIPRESEPLLHWLYDRWVEKEALLDCYYKTGHFPSSASSSAREGAFHKNADLLCDMYDCDNSRSMEDNTSATIAPTKFAATHDKQFSQDGNTQCGSKSSEGSNTSSTGVIDNSLNRFRPMPVNVVFCCLLYVIFLISSYVHFRMFSYAYCIISDIFF